MSEREHILNKCFEMSRSEDLDIDSIEFAEIMVGMINKNLTSGMGLSREVLEASLEVKCRDPVGLSLSPDYFRDFFPNYNDEHGFWKMFWSGWENGSQK